MSAATIMKCITTRTPLIYITSVSTINLVFPDSVTAEKEDVPLHH